LLYKIIFKNIFYFVLTNKTFLYKILSSDFLGITGQDQSKGCVDPHPIADSYILSPEHYDVFNPAIHLCPENLSTLP
jgi:hypothetical protein